jgi:hypothetical protein
MNRTQLGICKGKPSEIPGLASLAATSMDQLMLVLGAMRERTEFLWRELLQKWGLSVLKIWTYPK